MVTVLLPCGPYMVYLMAIILCIALAWIWAVKSSKQELFCSNPHFNTHYPLHLWHTADLLTLFHRLSLRKYILVNSFDSLKPGVKLSCCNFENGGGLNTSLHTRSTPALYITLWWLIISRMIAWWFSHLANMFVHLNFIITETWKWAFLTCLCWARCDRAATNWNDKSSNSVCADGGHVL